MPVEVQKRFLLDLHKVVVILYREMTGGVPDPVEFESDTELEKWIEDRINHSWPELELAAKKKLTKDSEISSFDGVKSPMKVLLNRLAKATQARGKKAALAKLLKISASNVSDWLDGKYEPSGEVTLRLLDWVTAEEANQQKTPGSATNTDRSKTRSTSSKNEIKNSGQQKS
jgi:hypothetical protein